MKALTLLAVLSLAGCATQTLSHATKGPVEFEQDRSECMAIAGQINAGLGDYQNPITFRDETIRCLKARGWHG